MREGYKDTPIGMIPEDWEVKKLGDVANLIMGQSPSSESYNEDGAGLYLVQGNADIKNRKTSPRIWTSEVTKECAYGDIIMTVRAPVGAIARSHHRSCIGRGVCAINSKSIDINFLYYYLVNYEPKWKSLEQGSTFTAVNGKDILGIDVPFPAIHEQTKVASILSTVDDKIDAINERITHTRQLKNGLMQRLLTRGIGHTKFKDSPLGEIPESWECVRSFDAFELLHGYQFRDYDFTEEGIPIIKIGQITSRGLIDLSDPSYIYSGRLGEFEDKIIRNGDVLMALTGATLGKSCIVKNLTVIALQNYRVGKFEPKNNKVLKPFLFFLINSPLILNQIFGKVNEAAQGNIGKSDFERLHIPVPPKPEQQRISEILSSVDDKLEVLQEKKTEYEQLEKGLMQQLLTGKMRVI